MPSQRRHRHQGRRRLLRTVLVWIPLSLAIFSLAQVLLLKYVPVKVTPLMIKRTFQNIRKDGYRIQQEWTRLDDISPAMIQAVIASEDGRFLEHHGFDFREMRKMLEEHLEKGKRIRGCSTISQQTAKNCFTFCSDTWFRKGVEAYYTVLIEYIWGKERIMEVYLNIAETGDGLFGAGAAARRYYGKDASQLTRRQAAAIACVLPDPLHRTPEGMCAKAPGRVSAIAGRAAATDISGLFKKTRKQK